MKLYEFITPSDPIIFKARDDRIAFACAVFLGNGKAGCHRIDGDGNETDLDTMLAFMPEDQVEPTIKENLGTSLDSFFEENLDDIRECLRSFAYGTVEDRRTYDDAIEAITDSEKLREFKSRHEERNRTSQSEWVMYAWELADSLGKKKEREQDG